MQAFSSQCIGNPGNMATPSSSPGRTMALIAMSSIGLGSFAKVGNRSCTCVMQWVVSTLTHHEHSK